MRCDSEPPRLHGGQARLGLVLEREDEMECLVAGCTFLLRAIYHEAFSFEGGGPNYVTPHCALRLWPRAPALAHARPCLRQLLLST